MRPLLALLVRRATALPLALAALWLAGCDRPAPAPPGPRPVVAYVVGSSVAGAEVNYSGEIRPRVEVPLAFRVGGKLVSRSVEVGDRVRAGQVLARLDPADVALAAQNTAAALAAAEAELALAGAEVRRTRELKEKNFVSQTLLDAKETTLAAAENRAKGARAQADLARNQQSYAVLLADGEGVVSTIHAEAGQVVAAGQPILRVARLGEREVVISIPENRVGELQQAGPLAVRLWASGERTYRGRLREIAPQADAVTRTYAARVSVLDADEAVRLGMTANVLLPSATAVAGSVAVPPSAVLQQGGPPQVWLIGADGKVSARQVEVAAYREDAVLLRSGLNAGERIVAAGVHLLHAGEAVQVLPATGRR